MLICICLVKEFPVIGETVLSGNFYKDASDFFLCGISVPVS